MRLRDLYINVAHQRTFVLFHSVTFFFLPSFTPSFGIPIFVFIHLVPTFKIATTWFNLNTQHASCINSVDHSETDRSISSYLALPSDVDIRLIHLQDIYCRQAYSDCLNQNLFFPVFSYLTDQLMKRSYSYAKIFSDIRVFIVCYKLCSVRIMWSQNI